MKTIKQKLDEIYQIKGDIFRALVEKGCTEAEATTMLADVPRLIRSLKLDEGGGGDTPVPPPQKIADALMLGNGNFLKLCNGNYLKVVKGAAPAQIINDALMLKNGSYVKLTNGNYVRVVKGAAVKDESFRLGKGVLGTNKLGTINI